MQRKLGGYQDVTWIADLLGLHHINVEQCHCTATCYGIGLVCMCYPKTSCCHTVNTDRQLTYKTSI